MRFKVKHNLDGSVQRYKARLVTKGFQQTLGINYFETFNLVVKFATIGVILIVIDSYHCDIRQVDVNNVFLNDDITETIFMS